MLGGTLAFLLAGLLLQKLNMGCSPILMSIFHGMISRDNLWIGQKYATRGGVEIIRKETKGIIAGFLVISRNVPMKKRHPAYPLYYGHSIALYLKTETKTLFSVFIA